MTGDSRRANVAAEVERGAESLRAAEVCLGVKLWDDAVSRAYYAAFHLVSALLLTEGLEARRHHGVHDLLFIHFIKPGRLQPKIAKLFGALQKYREQADYSRAFRFDEEGAREEVEHARAICSVARDELTRGGWLSTP